MDFSRTRVVTERGWNSGARNRSLDLQRGYDAIQLQEAMKHKLSGER